MTAAELAAWLTTLGDVEVRVIGERNAVCIADGARPIIGVFEPTDDGPDFYCIVETGT